MQGILVKKDSNESYVFYENKIYKVYAKGNLKKELKPKVGDVVEFSILEDGYGYIKEIKPRKNSLDRPKIANVDQVLIVTALYEPLFSSFLLNKYIMMLETLKIKPILIFTKVDLLKESSYYQEVMHKINWYEKMHYQVLIINNKDNLENKNTIILKLKELLKNKISVFTGQTGAGKSTTLNNFLDINKQIKTNEISKKLNRGKHTTTSIQLYNLENNIFIADTPGFSAFDLNNIDIEHILYSWETFIPFLNKCKFVDCTHTHETKCVVKKAVAEHLLPTFIYNDYVKVYEELKQNRKNKY
ncbi:ribosome small subunit-dependent GTPase A [Mycoplasma capricolum]|uniref:Small ribosomal subunit biogenesis GTPase RsgA n=1 Tax=Mycoplasma capricolum subsp. capricolum (strain California kid / ATCC 27343 / NCTC 10154) TaxID=340047 RepID=Q2SSL6_MYCCT|nr:ribosome small subunit-dependent GTPase A [Mycoplasma capricolum]ABC01369.1 ribosome small subunit-dependent GTPase A [Mycoplasma capricolum subsp. capricolum ATCC 27343]MCK8461932.1 ribosome small subunit-dependent GTPase A [Mycoplasma capricolum subsp. capricolum]